MREIAEDTRFSHILKDAKFKKLPKKEVKVKIDKRFESMFHEKKFQLKYEVDKRGRSVNLQKSDDLKRYYDLSDTEDDLKSKNDDEKDAENAENRLSDLKLLKINKSEKKALTPDIKKKLKDLSVDYARGEGKIYSDSSSEEESSESEGKKRLYYLNLNC